MNEQISVYADGAAIVIMTEGREGEVATWMDVEEAEQFCDLLQKAISKAREATGS